jgi:hypothetical protein
MRVVNGVLLQPEAGQVYSTNAAAVVPSDTVPLTDVTRYLYVGVTGDVTVIMWADATKTPVLFKAVPAGTLLPIAVTQVMATGTTATQMVAMY